MGQIEILKSSITALATDAIVNAANEGLWAGGGVCGAIFQAAGSKKLQDACNAIGHCDTGSAVITPGFNLKAKYIIHAVGPVWHGGNQKEPQLLYLTYRRSLELAAKYKCKSIGFPLISAGIYGYPKDQAWRKAIQACNDFLQSSPNKSFRIVFAVLDDATLEMGKRALEEIAPRYAKVARDETEEINEDSLRVGDKAVDAVFFHLPSETNGYLSNWYHSPFVLDGIRFSSTEQYIMYEKCRVFGDQAAADAILATDDPQLQQSIGRQAKGYVSSVWAGMRQLVAVRGLMAKFSQNEDLEERLLYTGAAWLVECAYSDTIWACGVRLNDSARFDTAQWRGQNILGFALMEVRAALRSKRTGMLTTEEVVWRLLHPYEMQPYEPEEIDNQMARAWMVKVERDEPVFNPYPTPEEFAKEWNKQVKAMKEAAK